MILSVTKQLERETVLVSKKLFRCGRAVAVVLVYKAWRLAGTVEIHQQRLDGLFMVPYDRVRG
jgi:hypothetical protein